MSATAVETPPFDQARYDEKRFDGVIQVMDRQHGDYRIMWDKSDEDETMEARHTFERLRAKGHLAYTVNSDGSKGETIREFDPTAERIILAPQLVGG